MFLLLKANTHNTLSPWMRKAFNLGRGRWLGEGARLMAIG